MKNVWVAWWYVCLAVALLGAPSLVRAQAAAVAGSSGGTDVAVGIDPAASVEPFTYTTKGAVTVEGRSIQYRAVIGTLILRGQGADSAVPQVAMSYTAYFKNGGPSASRPITFLYNGGPGSSSFWLHIGAWGPKRVVLEDGKVTEAPFRLVNNDYSLLDASDLVFVDMPDTGFGRFLVRGDNAAERRKSRKSLADAYWGVDEDADAFARFIKQFLTQYDRWESPKYLYGESYGTTRTAVLANKLQRDYNIGLAGVMLQSSILNFSLSIDGPATNPGSDMPYVLALPTYAASAWYYHKLPAEGNESLSGVLERAITYATTDYARALAAGSTLSASQVQEVAARLHQLTGLPEAYWAKANLRVDGGMFEHELLSDADLTTGRFDTRFSGPTMDPMASGSSHDPQSAAIDSAFVAGFNAYVYGDLKLDKNVRFRIGVWDAPDFHWDWIHKVPGLRFEASARAGMTNVMPDLADAMKYNPRLKVMLIGGLFDLSTPFYTATYEIEHLPIPRSLRHNVYYEFLPAGHMMYVNVPSLHRLHDAVAKFMEAAASGAN